MTAIPPLGVQLVVVIAIIGSLVTVAWLDRRRDWGTRRRSRLLLGLPWGTIVSITLVLGVYLIIQGGWAQWQRPVTVAYRSWSYLYPLGMGISAFAHHGPGHLIGNLTGALVVGSLAEYAWGHFPQERGASSFSSPTKNPYVRAFGFFPCGVILVGLLTSLFSWGPTIGFSGVVFALVGFALVRYPIAAVVALEVDDVVRIVYRALRDPVLIAEAKPQFVEPWWAGIAVQGHLFGLFLGIVAGAIVLRGREADPAKLWVGMVILATSLSLWAIWWFRGGDQFVLFRGIGVVVVFGLALLVTVGFRARASSREFLAVPARNIALLLLVFPILVVGAVALPLNLNTVGDTTLPGPTIEVRDYEVGYAEDVRNRQVSVVNVTLLGETTRVKTSGVIVISPTRQVWTRQISPRRLAFAGNSSVRIGGIGWSATVGAARRGWSVVGNGTVYRVWLRPPDGDWQLVYLSDPLTAEPILAGNRVSIRPTSEGFAVDLKRSDMDGGGPQRRTGPLPAANESTTVHGITFVRENDSVFALFNESRIRVATKERYPGRD